MKTNATVSLSFKEKKTSYLEKYRKKKNTDLEHTCASGKVDKLKSVCKNQRARQAMKNKKGTWETEVYYVSMENQGMSIICAMNVC